MNQSQIKQLSNLLNSSISVFTQTLSKFDKLNMLCQSERCAGKQKQGSPGKVRGKKKGARERKGEQT